MRCGRTFLALALAAAGPAGCLSPRAARIAEKAELFASLPPYDQNMIRRGLVSFDYTPDMVYLALGRPDKVETVDTQQGQVTTWTYRNFVYGGSTGGVRLGVNNPGSRYTPGRMVSSTAPGGPSLSSTQPGPVQPSIANMGDPTIATLWVDFIDDAVVGLRIDQ